MEDKKVISITSFFSQSDKRLYKKGEVIIRPDDFPTGVYFIEQGYIRIYSITEQGDERLHLICKPGEIFPLIWALHGNYKGRFYESMGQTILRKIPREEFLRNIKDNSSAQVEINALLISILGVFSDRIDNLEISKSYPRVIARLLFLAKRFGKKDGDTIIIEPPITHKDIASSIAMTRETASREMEHLEKKGIIGYHKHFIVVYSIERLKRELDASFERDVL